MDTRRISYGQQFRPQEDRGALGLPEVMDMLRRQEPRQGTGIPNVIASLYGANKKVSDFASDYLQDNALFGAFSNNRPQAPSQADMEEEITTRALDAITPFPMMGMTKGVGKIAGALPMDEASRMQRAKDIGFDVDIPVYHGSADEITAFDKGWSGQTTGNNPNEGFSSPSSQR